MRRNLKFHERFKHHRLSVKFTTATYRLSRLVYVYNFEAEITTILKLGGCSFKSRKSLLFNNITFYLA